MDMNQKKVKKHPFEVFFEGEHSTGAVLADQVRTMDFTKRNIEFIEKTSPLVMDHMEAKLTNLIKG